MHDADELFLHSLPLSTSLLPPSCSMHRISGMVKSFLRLLCLVLTLKTSLSVHSYKNQSYRELRCDG